MSACYKIWRLSPSGMTLQNGRTQAHDKGRGPEPPGPRRGTGPPRSGEAGRADDRSRARRPVCAGPRYRRGRVSAAPTAARDAGATPSIGMRLPCLLSRVSDRAGVREQRLAACADARTRLHRTCPNFPPPCEPASALPGPVMPEASSHTFAFGRPAPDPGPGRRSRPTTAERRIAGAVSQSEASTGSRRIDNAPTAVRRPWPAARAAYESWLAVSMTTAPAPCCPGLGQAHPRIRCEIDKGTRGSSRQPTHRHWKSVARTGRNRQVASATNAVQP